MAHHWSHKSVTPIFSYRNPNKMHYPSQLFRSQSSQSDVTTKGRQKVTGTQHHFLPEWITDTHHRLTQPGFNKHIHLILCSVEFYVLLTMHLSSVLVNNQLDTLFFFFCIYLFQFSTCLDGTPNGVPCKPAHLTVTYIVDIYRMSY